MKKETNQGGTKLVEEIENKNSTWNFEIRVSIFPFQKIVIRDIYALYRWKRHFSEESKEEEKP